MLIQLLQSLAFGAKAFVNAVTVSSIPCASSLRLERQNTNPCGVHGRGIWLAGEAPMALGQAITERLLRRC
jgi:hypothetical protein